MDKTVPGREPGKMRFSGKVAVVTGGASGIGRAVALRFAGEGAMPVIVDFNEQSLSEMANEFESGGVKALTLLADVSSNDAVVAAVEQIVGKCQRIDALVNCAGISGAKAALETSIETWNRVVGINLTGSFLMCREVARVMVGRKQGTIVNIASVDAHSADPGYVAYNASKAGVLGLTQTLAIELASSGIRVNSVSPGLVGTPLVLKGSASRPEIQAYIADGFHRVPMGRFIKPEEIAAACVYLSSDDASGITGTDLLVDGGLTADLYLVNAFPREASKAT